MRVLWLCNTVPTDLCDLFGFKRKYYEGWITGMLRNIILYDDIDLALCIPIRNLDRMKDGNTAFYGYFSFHITEHDDCTQEQVKRFSEIIDQYNPDVVHIWGSEYGQSLSMIRACDTIGIRQRTLVHIQGLISAIERYYNVQIPDKWVYHRGESGSTIDEEKKRIRTRGKNELSILSMAEYVLGRTEWDKNYIKSVNYDLKYRYCGEILRDEFYLTKHRWNVSDCEKHSIFITQGGYALKGIHLIVPAIAILRKRFPDIRVFISGDSSLTMGGAGCLDAYGEYLKILMKKYKVEDCFEFVGPLDPGQMIERYIKANIVAIPSSLENSSNSIGEAQLLGVPVVASFTGGTPSIIEHAKTGMLYQMDAHYMFAGYVQRLFEDDTFAELISINEQKIAMKRYDPKIVSNQLYQIYKEVVNI